MKKIIASIILVSLLNSCGRESMEEINTDPNSFYTTVPSSVLTYAQKQLADYVTTPNVNVNNLRLTMQYWQTTTYQDESRYNFSTRNVSNQVWNYLYVRVLKNLEQIFLDKNEITTFPETLLQLKGLQMLSLTNNKITGEIPDLIPALTFLDNNRFTTQQIRNFILKS